MSRQMLGKRRQHRIRQSGWQNAKRNKSRVESNGWLLTHKVVLPEAAGKCAQKLYSNHRAGKLELKTEIDRSRIRNAHEFPHNMTKLVELLLTAIMLVLHGTGRCEESTQIRETIRHKTCDGTEY